MLQKNPSTKSIESFFSKLENFSIKHFKTSLSLIWKLPGCTFFDLFLRFSAESLAECLLHFNENLPRKINPPRVYINKFFDGSCTNVSRAWFEKMWIKMPSRVGVVQWIFCIWKIFMILFSPFINEIYHELPFFIFLHADFVNLSCLDDENKKKRKSEGGRRREM